MATGSRPTFIQAFRPLWITLILCAVVLRFGSGPFRVARYPSGKLTLLYHDLPLGMYFQRDPSTSDTPTGTDVENVPPRTYGNDIPLPGALDWGNRGRDRCRPESSELVSLSATVPRLGEEPRT